jgi:RNA polymerase sigma-70 factor (ECF subfamily)
MPSRTDRRQWEHGVVTMDLLARARAGDGHAFGQLVDPYRRELQVHCYRILGSVQDAEDALQDTLLSAWQGLPGFEGRASVRTWLYRVATSRCLDALRSARRRPPASTVPAGEPPPGLEPPEPTRLGEVLWLEPYPDVLLDDLADSAPGPEARYEAAESISLAFVKALQLLPPRQRAALILRDVLGFHAREAALILGSSEESLTSALKRARAALERRQPAGSRELAPPPKSPAERGLVDRLTKAFQAADVDGIVALLTEDAWMTMPPLPLEYQGRELAGRFLAATAFRPGWTARLLETRANRQPAFGFYVRDSQTGDAHTVGLLVLTLSGTQICAMTRFDAGTLPRFGLPLAIPA